MKGLITLVACWIGIAALAVGDPVLDVTPQAADGIVLGVGPDMQVLPAGRYQFVTVYADGSQPTVVTQTIGGDVPGPVPPPPSDLAEQVKAALDACNDENKAKTSEALAIAYSQLIKEVNAGNIETATGLGGAVKVFTTTLTMAAPREWEQFSEVVDGAVGKCPSLNACVGVLELIVGELEAVQ